MRIALGEALRRKPNALQQVASTVDSLVLGHAMHLRPKRHRILDGQAWVERCIAVLKHHLHLSAKRLQRQVATADREAVKHHLAGPGIYQLH